MRDLKRFFIPWFLLFLTFFLVVGGVVWLTSRDSTYPPPGEYKVTRVTRITGLTLDWYEISFKKEGEDKSLKISPSKLEVETSEDPQQASLSVDEEGVSLNLPTGFEIEQGNILFSVTFAAFIFSLVSVTAYFIFASYLPQG